MFLALTIGTSNLMPTVHMNGHVFCHIKVSWWHDGSWEQNLGVVFCGCTWSISCSWGAVKYTPLLHACKQQFDSTGLVTVSSVGGKLAACPSFLSWDFFCLKNESLLFFCAGSPAFSESTNRFWKWCCTPLHADCTLGENH